MGKEDLLSKQINQLGFFLRKMLEKMTGNDTAEESLDVIINAELKETLGFDLKYIEEIPNDEIVSCLLQNEYFTPENVEVFADILLKTGKVDLQKKALLLYEYVNLKTATFSMERNLKMKKIKESL